MWISVKELCERDDLDRSYIYKLIRDKSLQSRLVNGQKEIEEFDPRFLQLLERRALKQSVLEAPPVEETFFYPIDWQEWRSYLARGEGWLCDDANSEGTIDNLFKIVKRFLREYKEVNLDNFRSAMAYHEEKMTRDNDRYTSRYNLFLAIRSLTRYLEYKGHLPSGTKELCEHIRPRRRVKKPIRKKYDPLKVYNACSVPSQAVSKRGNKAYRDYDKVLNKTLLLTAFTLGARISEICGIRVGDLNFEEEELILYGKGGRPRLVGLPQELQECLREYLSLRRSPSPQLFVSEGGVPQTPAYVRRRFARMAKWAEMEGLSPHAIRRTVITHLLNDLNAPMPVVQEMVGHSSLAVTGMYAETRGKAVKQYMNTKRKPPTP